mmetsp:Transcript_71961/g.145981  ORF Transcript_71961/g.145981 Transcript_71961/m.145981 type:complete len:205 (-) Transcript_71961:529-1143(-)
MGNVSAKSFLDRAQRLPMGRESTVFGLLDSLQQLVKGLQSIVVVYRPIVLLLLSSIVTVYPLIVAFHSQFVENFPKSVHPYFLRVTETRRIDRWIDGIGIWRIRRRQSGRFRTNVISFNANPANNIRHIHSSLLFRIPRLVGSREVNKVTIRCKFCGRRRPQQHVFRHERIDNTLPHLTGTTARTRVALEGLVVVQGCFEENRT